ncbi:16S rRNA (guanine(966)-N(2))-methyltransferase RsmD [Salisediminibacterium beveridgei]|uniref:Putative rRNA methyltransferase ylbH n=1 Tax=Salisediminibacterium beveridgei TaxID=632773 RepID=A0A1D7QWB1_9BACI|nr:16S rRNA (guanine(966)-N(2))-methyltransferase RsmD [Salisediminibacterium beveridgei]AOM83292.1 Putative rRNA methyltransferase ylbH [Salisediminibacterium beveridgei]
MRVISGQMKGKKLKSVAGMSTRPTSDKVKEAIYQILGPYFDGGVVLDLYAGSGAMGIEALSRGMDKGIFNDKTGQAIRTIKENLRETGLMEQSEVYRNDAQKALNHLAERNLQFHLIILDPPYQKQAIPENLSSICELDLLHAHGVILCEHDRKVELPEKIDGIVKVRNLAYGDTVISLYEWSELHA